MAETSSFPEQWLVPLASGLRKGVDDRMPWVTEVKNFGGGLYRVRMGVGLPTPDNGIMGRVRATASRHFAVLKYTLAPYPDAFPFLDLPQPAVQSQEVRTVSCYLLRLHSSSSPHFLFSSSLTCGWATSPLKPFLRAVEWLTVFLPKPK